MAGIYVHIPFCKSKCNYCNFLSVASLKFINDYIDALIIEIINKKHFFDNNCIVQTIYFGGGTPSLLKITYVEKILNSIKNNFKVYENAEITFEMNPDDVNDLYLKSLRKIGINRLSIGCQSFNDIELEYLGRKHSAEKAFYSVVMAKKYGFENISIDIIYGLPEKISCNPEINLEKIKELNVKHISAYSLTMEKNTILSNKVKKGIMLSPNEDVAADNFIFYMKELKKMGYMHYEISNYASPNYQSKHNSAYWENIPYLGVGAGAHSFNLFERCINTSNISNYIKCVNQDTEYSDKEILTENDKYNEYVMTSIRTSKGIDINYIKNNFDKKFLIYFLKNIVQFVDNKHVLFDNSKYILSDTGKLWCDKISEKLFFIDNCC
jgi:oxygen-independent coproporphyrinogen-3 oxidase